MAGFRDLWRCSATHVISLLREGVVTPLDLLDICEARLTATEPSVNAVPILCMDRARKSAEALMAHGYPSCPPPGYLYGLPVVVKDLTPVEGVRFTQGCPLFADRVAPESDPLVKLLERNGAIVVGKSNTPEFGAGANTFNTIFGATRNPFDTRLTAGGSSGGSAAALAVGSAWLATGTDLGGSCRIPAAFCSVVGFRPSPGRVPSQGKPLLDSVHSVAGPLARSVTDLALLLDAMAGGEGWPQDAVAPPLTESYSEIVKEAQKGGNKLGGVTLRPKRVAWSEDLAGEGSPGGVEREVKDVCRAAVGKWVKGVGAEMLEGCCPDLGGAMEVFSELRAAHFATAFPPEFVKGCGPLLKPEVRWNCEQGYQSTPQAVGLARKRLREILGRVDLFFTGVDILCCPCVSVSPFDVNIRYLSAIEGHPVPDYTTWLGLTSTITVTQCPAISVPCGFLSDGRPVGLQMVGPPNGDAQLLAMAALFESILNLDQRVPRDPSTGEGGLPGSYVGPTTVEEAARQHGIDLNRAAL